MRSKFFLISRLMSAVVFSMNITVQATEVQSSESSVTVKVNQQTYSFSAPPRLAEVLAPQALSQSWYWPASKLFRLEQQPLHQRQVILNQLQGIAIAADDDLVVALTTLQNELMSWQLGQRITIPLDYDLARVDPAMNPRFEPGRYQVILSERPSEVRFFGALQQSVSLEHRSGAAVSEYIADLTLHTVADSQQVIVIQPDGRLVSVGTKAWNKQHVELMPGAMVYIPFAEGWFSNEFKVVNQQIPALAVHRMY